MNFQKGFFDELAKEAQGYAPPAMYGGFKPAGIASKSGLLSKFKAAVKRKLPKAMKKPLRLK